MCTIADAKVRQNYNCYNVYFNECLQIAGMWRKTTNASEKNKSSPGRLQFFLKLH